MYFFHCFRITSILGCATSMLRIQNYGFWKMSRRARSAKSRVNKCLQSMMFDLSKPIHQNLVFHFGRLAVLSQSGWGSTNKKLYSIAITTTSVLYITTPRVAPSMHPTPNSLIIWWTPFLFCLTSLPYPEEGITLFFLGKWEESPFCSFWFMMRE